MTLVGAATGSIVLAIVVGHAVAEGRAFARAAPVSLASPIDTNPADALWLASVLSVIALEGAAIAEALWTEPSAWRMVLATIGSSASVVGIRLRIQTIHQLGATIALPPSRAQPALLITRGLFSVVRHPSELGLLLLSAGILAIALTWITATLFVAVVLPLMAARVEQEERALAKHFGEQYAAYRRSTPLVWPTLSAWPELFRQSLKPKRS
jgi:protein-S-isoprenylcysteine O-methyltransferase Ste14